MVLPPQITPEQLQEMLNIAAPSPDVPSPLAANFQTAGSDIGYIAGQRQTPYSPEELPEWMANFQQISPTLFAPSQGVFQEAPIVPSIQSTMPQNYADEYADLERLFQESIAVDPTQFGDIYRGGTMLPRQSIEGISGDQLDPLSTLAAAVALEGVLSDTEGKFQEVYEPVEEFVQQKVLDPVEDTFKIVADPVEEFVQQSVLDPAEDAFKFVADPVEEFVQQSVLDPAEDAFKFAYEPIEELVQQSVLDPIEDIAKIPLGAVEEVLPEVDINIEYKDFLASPTEEGITEPSVITEPAFTEDTKMFDYEDGKLDINITLPKFDIPEKLEEILDSISSGTGKLTQTAGAVGDAYVNLENLIQNPSGDVAEKAIESINKAYDTATKSTDVKKIGSEIIDSGETGRIIPPAVADTVISAADTLAIVNALEDPSAKSITTAYSAADNLVERFGSDGMGLPAGQSIGLIGTALTGIEALDGGIDSAGDAAAVAAGAKAAANLVEQFATDAATKAAAGSVANYAGMASSFLGPVATAIAIEDILAEDLSVKDILQGLPLGLGRVFGGGGSSFGEANLARDESGSYIIGSEKSKNKAFEYILPETNAAGYILKTLEDQYNYEFDPDAWEKVDKQITFDTKGGKDKTPFGTTSQDIVVDALQKGALKPTADSPTDIDWSSLFADARQNTGQSKKGTKLYHPSEVKRPEEYRPLAYLSDLLGQYDTSQPTQPAPQPQALPFSFTSGSTYQQPTQPTQQPPKNTGGFSPIFGSLGSYSLF